MAAASRSVTRTAGGYGARGRCLNDDEKKQKDTRPSAPGELTPALRPSKSTATMKHSVALCVALLGLAALGADATSFSLAPFWSVGGGAQPRWPHR